MEVVLGLLGILVLNLTETNLVVSHNLAVLTILQAVLVSEMKLVVTDNMVVLGLITLNRVQVLMSLLVVAQVVVV